MSTALVERFQKRMVDLAKEGVFGGLRTRHRSLQTSYAHLLSLLDSPEVPITIYGEKGSGKRRHVDELLQLHNFCRKLQNIPAGALKVFRGDFVSEGFTQLLQAPTASEADILYLEGIDLMNLKCQQEFLDFLKRRRHFAEKGLPLPRLVIGTERALSILVLREEFNKELFQAITGFAVFLPTLKERAEDLPHLVQVFAEEISGKRQSPAGWFVDFVSRWDWDSNLDELKNVIKAMLARKADMALWNTLDLPPAYQPRKQTTFTVGVTAGDAQRFRSILNRFNGDRKASARELGLPYADFLQQMVVLGIR